MKDDEIETVCRNLGVTDAGMEIVSEIRSSEPARRVRASSGGNNTAIRYPSAKMGVMIQAESESLEYATLLLNEFRSNVLEIYDQPPARVLRYVSGKRKLTVRVVEDYFVIADDYVGYLQCKPRSILENLCRKAPDRYLFNATTGKYRSPAFERNLEGTGLSYQFVTEDDIPRILVENLDFLDGYLYRPCPDSIGEKIRSIKTLVERHKGIQIRELIAQGHAADAIYYAIAMEEIYFPLNYCWLADHELAWVFHDQSYFRKLSPNLGILVEQSNSSEGVLPEPLVRATVTQIELASKKLEMLTDLERGNVTQLEIASEFSVTDRTVRRWKSAFDVPSEGRGKLENLLPAHYLKGRRDGVLEEEIEDVILDVIDREYLTKRAPSKREVIFMIQDECSDRNLNEPAESTLYLRLQKIDLGKSALARQGAKAAYQQSAFELLDIDEEYWVGSSRYLQHCHIDHTQIDVEVLDEHGKNPKKPWLSVIVDEYSTKILASYISYLNPSYVTVMMLIRSMVRDHNVLPEAFVVDGGKEFEGNDFEILVANCRVKVRSRKGRPRAGGIVERLFGTINTELLHNIEGNSKYMKNVRMVSKDFQAKRSAFWSLYDVVRLLNWYAEDFNLEKCVCAGQTPAGLAESSILRFGARHFLSQMYDKAFEFLTFPSIKRRTVTVKTGKNCRYDNKSYWHNTFRNASPRGEKCEAKYDPEDDSRLFVYFRGKWIECALSSRSRSPGDRAKQIKAEQRRADSAVNSVEKRQSRRGMARANRESRELLLEEKKLKARKNKEAPVEGFEIELETKSFWSAEVCPSREL